MGHYKYLKTKKLITQLKPFYKEFKGISDKYWNEIYKLETKIQKQTKIDGIEFFFADNELAGIGNADRTMELIHRDELED